MGRSKNCRKNETSFFNCEKKRIKPVSLTARKGCPDPKSSLLDYVERVSPDLKSSLLDYVTKEHTKFATILKTLSKLKHSDNNLSDFKPTTFEELGEWIDYIDQKTLNEIEENLNAMEQKLGAQPRTELPPTCLDRSGASFEGDKEGNHPF